MLHGDRVMASVTGVDRRGRREAAIVEVLERRLNRLIGRFTLEAGISYVAVSYTHLDVYKRQSTC